MAANFTVPPIIGTLRLNNGRVATFYETERGSFERALASGATPVDPPPANTTTVNGKEVAKTADVPPPAEIVTTAQSQATSAQNGFNVGIPLTDETGTVSSIRRNPETGELYDAGGLQAPTSGGVGAGTSPIASNSRNPDNTPPVSSNTSQQFINQTFATQRIVAQPNVLDQYASYTYAISWWLLTPGQYNELTSGLAPAPGSGNWSLLMQSGGAPIAGRNQAFPLDYYLDDLEIETYMAGHGTGMSTNGMAIKFKVVEPNGLTLIQKLYEAVQGAVFNDIALNDQPGSGANTARTVNADATDQPLNYGAAQYCLTIEFYGYDDRGNLVAPARGQIGTTGQLSTTNPQSVIKKYYPFLIQDLTFRTVANQVEYHVEGQPVNYNTGTSQARGTIPFSFQLSGQTVGQLLQGGPVVTATAQASPGERIPKPAPNMNLATNSQIDEFLTNAAALDARQGSVSAVSAGAP
jgi:hypothetical protein